MMPTKKAIVTANNAARLEIPLVRFDIAAVRSPLVINHFMDCGKPEAGMQGGNAINVRALACFSNLSYVEYISFQLFRFFDNTAPLICSAGGSGAGDSS
jgi:hypothetical protein